MAVSCSNIKTFWLTSGICWKFKWDFADTCATKNSQVTDLRSDSYFFSTGGWWGPFLFSELMSYARGCIEGRFGTMFIDTFGIFIDSFIVPIIIYFFEAPSYLLKVNHLFRERVYTLALVLYLYFCHPTLRAQSLTVQFSSVNLDKFLENFLYCWQSPYGSKLYRLGSSPKEVDFVLTLFRQSGKGYSWTTSWDGLTVLRQSINQSINQPIRIYFSFKNTQWSLVGTDKKAVDQAWQGPYPRAWQTWHTECTERQNGHMAVLFTGTS